MILGFAVDSIVLTNHVLFNNDASFRFFKNEMERICHVFVVDLVTMSREFHKPARLVVLFKHYQL